MVYFHKFIIPLYAALTVKCLNMTSYYKVRGMCYSASRRWLTSHNSLNGQGEVQTPQTFSLFFLFHIEAASKTNIMFVRQFRCVGRSQIGKKVTGGIFGAEKR
jgi:hypothetical protein